MRCCGAWHARAPAQHDAATRWRSTFRHGCCDRWTQAYGEDEARRIARGVARRGSARRQREGCDPQAWAERLGGHVLPTGSVRLAAGGRIEDLPGYSGWGLVGAGRCRRAAGPPAWHRLRVTVGCRSVCGAGRQDGSARRGVAATSRRSTLRLRRLKRLQRQPRAAAAQGAARRGRRGDLDAGAHLSTRCCSMRPARRPERSAATPTSCT